MNKRFSTLVAAFAAIATVSYAQIGDKYVHLKTSSTYLTVTKENPVKADSVKLAPLGSSKAAKDSALWLPKFVEKMVSGDSVFQFVNKATKKNLSFAVKKNGAGEYGTMIAPGLTSLCSRQVLLVVLKSMQLMVRIRLYLLVLLLES